ncbi:hypothetical protein [Streptomyces sp. PTY087I2]|uniref:hypothetical protein n=1 Tax=Streptomyces sp. PTY087I2 TaxID=1819298 RepID=UPI00210021EB|nr:hypothetical protein [Streptomyces sp. PTY087I2]
MNSTGGNGRPAVTGRPFRHTGATAAAAASRSIGDEHLLALTRNLTSESAKDRERACETICDWVRSFDRREARTLASLLASAAALEQDADCLESELNALGELSATGLFDAEDIAALRRLPRESIRPADVEHLDYLMEEYFPQQREDPTTVTRRPPPSSGPR